MSDKYTLPEYAASRIRYYDGLFLLDSDFIGEQAFHLVRQMRHERLLHAPGVTEGLDVTLTNGGASLSVAPGSALDEAGRQICLTAAKSIYVDVPLDGLYIVEISFAEEETDIADSKSAVASTTRFTQKPVIQIVSAQTTGSVVLARVSVVNGVGASVDSDTRLNAGVRLPAKTGSSAIILRTRTDGEAAELSAGVTVADFIDVTTDLADPATVHLDPDGASYFNGGDVGIGTASPGGALDVRVGGEVGWDRFVVTADSSWGDVGKSYVTIAGGSSGLMIKSPYVPWSSARASIRYGRSGGASSGSYWCVGARSGGAFSFSLDGESDHKVWIASSGDVAVGATDSGGYKLWVAGTLGASGAAAFASLSTSGAAAVGGTLNATGATTLSSTLSVGAAASMATTLAVTGATTLSSTLAVTGASTLSSVSATSASVSGAVTVGTTLGVTGATTLTSLAATGAVTVGTTLAVTGSTTLASGANSTVTLSGAATLSKTLTVAQGATLQSTLGVTGATTLASLSATSASISGAATVGTTLGVTGATTLASLSATSASISGAATVGTTLGVTGAATLSSTLAVAGSTTLASGTNSTLTVSGAATLSKTLTVTQGATLQSTLSVTGATTLAALTATGAAALGSTLSVTGASTLAALTASGAAALGSTLAVTGAATLSSTLAVTGAVTLASNLTLNGDRTLTFDKTDTSLIKWNSNANGSDGAFIRFKSDSDFVAAGTENVRLTIGVFNDFGNGSTHADALDIQGGTQLALNAGSWDTELNTAICTPGVGGYLKGISLRVNNSEVMKIGSSSLTVTSGTSVTGIPVIAMGELTFTFSGQSGAQYDSSQTYTFSQNVKEAYTAIAGWNLWYANSREYVDDVGVYTTHSFSGATVTAKVVARLKDDSGTFDDSYAGTIKVLIIAVLYNAVS